MRIGLDLDGTSIDFDKAWVDRYNDWFDAEVDIEDVRANGKWHAFNRFTHFGTVDTFWAWAMQVPDFWLRMEPIRGALGGIYHLLRMGHEFVVITHRHESAQAETEEWLHRHWPHRGHELPEQHYAVDKGLVDCDLWIDDAPHVISRLMDAEKHVVKYDRPYNDRTHATATVGSWREFVAYVLALDAKGGRPSQ